MSHLDNTLVSFVFITVVLTITPGVDTFVVMRNVLRGGKLDGILTGVGICSGLFFHASLSALGVSIILVQSAYLFGLVKTIGAVYLIWLGCSCIYGTLVSGNRSSPDVLRKIEYESVNTMRSFREGFLSNVLNPKCAVFYMAFFPQFIDGSDHVYLKAVSLVGIQFVIGVLWLTVLSILIVHFKKIIEKPFFLKSTNAVCGTVLVGFGIKLGIDS